MAMQNPDDSRDRNPSLALNRMLRELPSRRAPAALESRVIAELARRAALPWWRLGFAHWPPGARVAFLAACGTIVGCTVLGAPWALSGLPAGYRIGALLPAWMEPAIAAMSCAAGVAALLLRVIPPLWFYATMGAAAALYATLFSLGAAAYSTLYRQAASGEEPMSAGRPRSAGHP
jgi:hypothetical protein